ncbi:MAG: hypothetical protein KC502_03545 [Myxococcales bacterium]|nr:hypothetical protein [Myxococcales bacterium]
MRRHVLPRIVVLLGTLVIATTAHADLSRFDIGARIYTKHLYTNDDTQGLLWLGNPFWFDQIKGGNGVGSELELTFKGRASRYVTAGARVASRFGERWQDYWESGTRMYGNTVNTSGDSVGMNRASYLKLRGTWVQVQPEWAFVDWLRVGSSDLGMFNPWTIGKLRYIDRDNGRGYFLSGHLGSQRQLTWIAAAIALPKLWVGPWWSTGLGDPELVNPFWSRDWAYATTIRWRPTEGTVLKLTADMTQDLETDLSDPDALGSTNPNCKDALGSQIPGCQSDHAVDLYTRYHSANATLQLEQELGETTRVDGTLAYSRQRIDTRLTGNGVAKNQGISPVVYKDTDAFAGTVRLAADDPWEMGLSFKAEYFNIGQDYNAIFGARREADVLLTDGFLGGGQLPTLNLANEFVDFGEAWVESCIGWHGGTGVATFENEDGDLKVDAEYTYITYNTNAQDRDVDTTYPDFLHSDGYTDIGLYDFANVYDRGRDPRSVYRRNQWRRSQIVMLRATKQLEIGRGLEIKFKGKYIRDEDYRRLDGAGAKDDDYKGNIFIARLQVAMPVTDGLKLAAGTQIDRWYETNRRGTLELGYGDDVTKRHTAFAQARYHFGGFRAGYHLEYVHKLQERQREGDQRWSVWRSKATVEVAW